MDRSKNKFRSTRMTKKVNNLEIVESPFNEKFETFDAPFCIDS
jgi:hypothetical protein